MRNKYNAKFYEENNRNKTTQNQYQNQNEHQLNRAEENSTENTNVEFGCEFCERRNPSKK